MNKYQQLKNMFIHQLNEINRIEKIIRRKLKKAPEGELVISSSNGIKQFFHKTEKCQRKGHYLDKTQKKLIIALAQKDYDERMLKEIEKRIKRISRMIEWLPEKGLEEVYEKLSPVRRELVTPYVLTDEQYIEQWLNVEYEGKTILEGTVSFLTENGEQVRSKSEKIIADKLKSMGIPYRYEYPLELDGYGTVYPDFMMLNVKNREEIYLEHFGMMDDSEYCDRTIAKIQNYARYGIFLGKNLLVTFETRYRPLSIMYLEELLQEFLK